MNKLLTNFNNLVVNSQTDTRGACVHLLCEGAPNPLINVSTYRHFFCPVRLGEGLHRLCLLPNPLNMCKFKVKISTFRSRLFVYAKSSPCCKPKFLNQSNNDLRYPLWFVLSLPLHRKLYHVHDWRNFILIDISYHYVTDTYWDNVNHSIHMNVRIKSCYVRHEIKFVPFGICNIYVQKQQRWWRSG